MLPVLLHNVTMLEMTRDDTVFDKTYHSNAPHAQNFLSLYLHGLVGLRYQNVTVTKRWQNFPARTAKKNLTAGEKSPVPQKC